MKRSILMIVLALLVFAPPAWPAEGAEEPLELPKGLAGALDSASAVTLYSLQPNGGPDLPAWDFHGHHIIGQVELHKDGASRAAGALKDAVSHGAGHAGSTCRFLPRHGLRVASQGHTYDLVISYRCGQVELYDNDHPADFGGLIKGKPAALNALLADANIPLADTPQALNDSYAGEAKQARALAEKGDKRAQEIFGQLLTSGKGVARDEDQGIKLLGQSWGLAAESPDFQIRLGKMYFSGTNIRQDYAEAKNLYGKAAGQGSATGQYLLGYMHEIGAGGDLDHAEAMKWFLKAADQGEPRAQYEIGVMYARGWGAPQDYEEALKWFQKAAEQGHAEAQTWLGSMYKDGQGVAADRAEAYFWYRVAQEYGSWYMSGIPELSADQKAAMEKRVADWKAKHPPCSACTAPDVHLK